MELLYLWSPASLSRDNWDANQVSWFIQRDQVMYFASCSMYETFWDLSLPSAVKETLTGLTANPNVICAGNLLILLWFEDRLPRPVSPVKQKSQSSILAKLNFFQKRLPLQPNENAIQTPLMHYVILLRQLIIIPWVRWFTKEQMDQLSNISHWVS